MNLRVIGVIKIVPASKNFRVQKFRLKNLRVIGVIVTIDSGVIATHVSGVIDTPFNYRGKFDYLGCWLTGTSFTVPIKTNKDVYVFKVPSHSKFSKAPRFRVQISPLN